MTRPNPDPDSFVRRHLGPRERDTEAMLRELGAGSLDELMTRAVPGDLRWRGELQTPGARTEVEVIEELRRLAEQNEVARSYIGMGYHGTHTPPVIQRNILENPGWYTQYTPYQAEIAQGRMEALLNFQTMVLDLTGMQVANSSLLDEATAAAEAMTLSRRVLGRQAENRDRFLVSSTCHPQTIAVVSSRAEPLGIDICVSNPEDFEIDDRVFGVLVAYPDTGGQLNDLEPLCSRAHESGALVTVTADLLALTLFRPPGEAGADIVVGNSQRFGVPLGYGGPHAAFMATRSDYKRQLPGRIVGLSVDARGKPAVRLALQTREQHIRREKATSNICTAQVLLAVMAAMYGVYHGPGGLRAIAERIRQQTGALARGLDDLGCRIETRTFFDTLKVRPRDAKASAVIANARRSGINLRLHDAASVGIALDETVRAQDLRDIFAAFGGKPEALDLSAPAPPLPATLSRKSPFMEHPVFHRHRSETELLRYMHRLETRDLSLTTSMIPLGSCTMKLNATAEMIPVSMPGFGALHPFAPVEQAPGYRILFDRLSSWLQDITGFAATSLQPNAGSQGE